MRAVEQRQRRPEQFLIQRVGVFGRERREIGVATGIERATQRADLVCQCLGPNADLVKGDPIAPQYPQPGRVLRGQIHQHRLVGREQGLRRFGRERLRVAQFGIGRKLPRDAASRASSFFVVSSSAARNCFSASGLRSKGGSPTALTSAASSACHRPARSCRSRTTAASSPPPEASLAVGAATAAPALDTSASWPTPKLSLAAPGCAAVKTKPMFRSM
jgi:hypothetical protein